LDANSTVLAESDIDDVDVGFESQEKITKPGRKAYEVEFKVYSPLDIQRYQDKQIEDVSNILGQPPEITAILLRHMRWNKERLIEQYMDRQAQMMEAVGFGSETSGSPRFKTLDDFMCEICCNEGPGLETIAMKCGHRFCTDCYKTYLSQKIKEEGEAARIKCPGDGCNRIVDSKSLDLLVASDLKNR
jgi:ariadne-1